MSRKRDTMATDPFETLSPEHKRRRSGDPEAKRVLPAHRTSDGELDGKEAPSAEDRPVSDIPDAEVRESSSPAGVGAGQGEALEPELKNQDEAAVTLRRSNRPMVRGLPPSDVSPFMSFTPLSACSLKGHHDIATLLIEAGAEVNLSDRAGDTALNRACFGGHTPLAKLLLDSRAQINQCNLSGVSALHFAATMGREETVKFLIERKACLNKKDSQHGMTPLMDAARRGRLAVCKHLVWAGADMTLRNQPPQRQARRQGHMWAPSLHRLFNKTAEDYARQNNHDRVAEFLAEESAGMQRFMPEPSGRDALAERVMRRDLESPGFVIPQLLAKVAPMVLPQMPEAPTSSQ